MKLKNIKFSWSKWGRVMTGLEKRPHEWHCQLCGELQPNSLEPFLFQIGDNQYIRLCSQCQRIRIVRVVRTFHRLKRLKYLIDNDLLIT